MGSYFTFGIHAMSRPVTYRLFPDVPNIPTVSSSSYDSQRHGRTIEVQTLAIEDSNRQLDTINGGPSKCETLKWDAVLGTEIRNERYICLRVVYLQQLVFYYSFLKCINFIYC